MDGSTESNQSEFLYAYDVDDTEEESKVEAKKELMLKK